MAEENSSASQVLDVDLGVRSYSIHIAPHSLNSAASLIQAAIPKVSHIACIYDHNVKSHAERVMDNCRPLARISRIEIPSGEASKCVEQMARTWNALLDEKTDRKSLIVAIGGGVVGDLAGFAAASFARGIPFVQVPTTLLSQVDSSVGGKTGINLPGAKNIVGAFWQPSLVIIDPLTLQSLAEREYLSGVAEVVKYGIIQLPEFFDYLEQNVSGITAQTPEVLAHIIAESCRAKAQVVQEDERETSGRRAILNYGHTFAHALESCSKYGMLLHGEAVSIGMHMAAVLAMQLGRVDQDFVLRQQQLLKALGLPTNCDQFPAAQLWEAMQHDKKVEHGKLRFVLPSRIGHVELVDGVLKEQACQAIDAANSDY